MFKRKRKENSIHCVECRLDLVEGEFRREPIGFEKVEGKLVPNKNRSYLFCLKCCSFLGLVDNIPSKSKPAPVRRSANPPK